MTSLKSFVIRSGRMSKAQERSYKALSSRFVIPFTGSLRNFAQDFGNENPLIVEIGFGMGKATAEIAAANPENNYLGIEVFRAGVGKLLWEIETRNLANVRIIEYDAVQVLEEMKAESVSAFHIFFPDPWPKKKHHKRRLLQRPFTDILASRLAPGGYVYAVTDWAAYGEFALAELSATAGLTNPYMDGISAGFAPRQEWRPQTKFEKKGLDGGRGIWEIMYVKQCILS